MKTPYSQLIIKYPNGTTQVVKPNMEFFQGDWQRLAQAVAGRFFLDQNVPYDLK